jgi:hypothetical protein
MNAFIERRRILDRPEYEMPARWRLTGYQTARIAIRRRNAALRRFRRSPKAAAIVRRWRLDNPFMTQAAWRIVLREAAEYSAEQRYGRRWSTRKRPSRRTAQLVPRRIA